ncbi:TetR/AcrR family transcriptional regulator [Vibrio ostreicida]|uniref:TetR/AcrR family transcriptional regulator n=1 Tax=Vibrio ostreicida TaxID=526588 RepID=UPI00097059ED|nr:TetR/AcrR family transcriptional regulator [Vibrio ostreicida]
MIQNTQPSRERILSAFHELMQNKDYYNISVRSIIIQASVGKTTFYRHFNRKLDVFVEVHDAFFEVYLNSFRTQEDWLRCEPHLSLIETAQSAAKKAGRRPTMAYQLGSDWPQAVRMLKLRLSEMIEKKLAHAFPNHARTLPLAELAGALATLNIDFMSQISSMPMPSQVEQRAKTLQCYIQALVNASL